MSGSPTNAERGGRGGEAAGKKDPKSTILKFRGPQDPRTYLDGSGVNLCARGMGVSVLNLMSKSDIYVKSETASEVGSGVLQ